MKLYKTILLGAILLGLALAGGAVLRKKGASESWRAGLGGSGFAVVELFTSEGCSSCPPADALVASVQQEDKNLPVYILAFHVDYWDRLGWKDAFSEEAYSERQRRYAAWLNLSSIYTPQIVVNGRKEFVGSEAGMLRAAIENGLNQSGDVQLSLSGLQLKGGRLHWQYKAEGGEVATAGKKGRLAVIAAVVERSATTSVRAGENSGKTLTHVQIVRSFQLVSLDGKGNGAGQLDWPTGLGAGDGEVIAFLQDQENGRIIAATRSAVE